MTIPESLQHYAEPSLIVVADHYRARLLLAFEDSVEEVDMIELPRTELSDNEGKEIGQERSDDSRLHQFVKMVAERVNTLIRDEEAAMNLHVIAPADVLNPLKKELAPEASNIIGKELALDVAKEDELSILKRLAA
jgi:protein required for attachment to host cells